jgi:UDP-glucuronate 4-epimerase
MNNLKNLKTANHGLRFFTVYGPCLSRGKRSFFHWDLSREMRSKFHREGRPDMALFLFTKAILENKPIQVFNNGNMPVPPVPWTYFSPLGWNAKQIPLGVRDFTYIDDIVEGVTRVIDSPPATASSSPLGGIIGGLLLIRSIILAILLRYS